MSRRTLPALLAALAFAAPAAAAPVSATATLSLTVGQIVLGTLTVAGSGTVDVTGGVITVPAGLVGLGGTLVVPVTSLTTVSALSLVGVGNQAGTFSIGGATAQAPGEVCPGGAASANSACNLGGGLGGLMGLTGTLNVVVVPGIVVIPLDLDGLRIGQGGSTNSPFTADAAPWTTGTALLNTGVNVHTTQGSTSGNGFLLVSPLFISACGNLFPVFSALTIELASVPEPAVWVSLWLGAFGLVWLTRRR